MSRWKPISLAIDLIVISVVVLLIVLSYGKYNAGFVDVWEILSSLLYVVVFSISVISLYKHFKGIS